MTTKHYDKLVRDRIPEIIKERGRSCKFRIADSKEYRQKLMEKLQEETSEFIETPCVEELADIQEVIDALLLEYKWTGLKATTQFKKITRGAFKERIILEEVSE
jgi:predicted house-cleaning noncanonical NTP pyrophosphatase (MazG superfamily)